MTSLLRLLALLVAFVLPLGSLSADGTTAVKCSVNQERVWVYDSPATLNVAEKLKCGEAVTLLAQGNGFVKVRTANGTEGYVPTENLPNVVAAVPAAPRNANTSSQSTVASAPRAASASRVAAVHPTPQPSATSAPAAAAASRTATAAEKTPNAAVKAATNMTSTAKPIALSAKSSAAAQAASPSSSHVATASATSHTRTKKATKSVSTATATAPAKPNANASAPQPPHPTGAVLVRTAATSSAPASPAAAPSNTNHSGNVYVGDSAVSVAAKPAAMKNSGDAPSDEEGDDNSYLVVPKSESDDPACRLYFSGYGLSPGQFKWITDNRQKRFPAVCPAATPAMVDYVIIFTHDAEFFNYTMPDPVHTEAGGFTDWNPIVLYDMTSVPRNEIDKSKREYVWVFHVKRGTYDPAKFSPHRRFQFTKIESKYSRTVEDAFDYIQAQGANR